DPCRVYARRGGRVKGQHRGVPRSFAPAARTTADGLRLRESRSFAPAALRMTSALALGRGKRETTLPPLILLNRARRCHPERARGTRASEGPACGRPRNKGWARHARERRTCLRPTAERRVPRGTRAADPHG